MGLQVCRCTAMASPGEPWGPSLALSSSVPRPCAGPLSRGLRVSCSWGHTGEWCSGKLEPKGRLRARPLACLAASVGRGAPASSCLGNSDISKDVRQPYRIKRRHQLRWANARCTAEGKDADSTREAGADAAPTTGGESQGVVGAGREGPSVGQMGNGPPGSTAGGDDDDASSLSLIERNLRRRALRRKAVQEGHLEPPDAVRSRLERTSALGLRASTPHAEAGSGRTDSLQTSSAELGDGVEGRAVLLHSMDLSESNSNSSSSSSLRELVSESLQDAGAKPSLRSQDSVPPMNLVPPMSSVPQSASTSGSAVGDAASPHPAPSGRDASADVQSVAAEVVAGVQLWRDTLGKPITDFFLDPDGRLLPPTRDSESLLGRRVLLQGGRSRCLGAMEAMDDAKQWGPGRRELLLSRVIRGSGFRPLDKGSVLVTREGASFLVVGALEDAPAAVLERVQGQLDLLAPQLIALLMEGAVVRDGAPAVGLIFQLKNSLLTFTLPGPVPLLLSLGSLALSLYLSTSAASLAIDLPASSITTVWQSCISPLCLLLAFSSSLAARTAVAARYQILHLLSPPIVLPSPLSGTSGSLQGYKGLLPSSQAAIDLSLASSLASLFTSAAVTAVACAASKATQIGEIPEDYIYVSADLFGNSGAFSSLLAHLSAAVILPQETTGEMFTPFMLLAPPPADAPQLLMDPLIFGGLLALRASLMSLIPCGMLDGRLLTAAAFGPQASRLLSFVCLAAFGIKFVIGDLQDGVLWCLMLGYAATRRTTGWPLRNAVSEPSLLRKCVVMFTILGGSSLLLF